jgi:hypothetical protein
MIGTPSIAGLLRIAFVFGYLSLHAVGQQPSTAPAAEVQGVERFRSFERTYQEGLKRIHLPLLTNYLTQLNQLAATSKEPNPALEKEIALVQKTLAAGGLVDLTRLGLPETQAIESFPIPADAESPPGAVLVLKAENAKGGTLLKSMPPSISLGEASWPIDRLSKGDYEVLALYCLPNPLEGASVSVSLGLDTFAHELSRDRTTKPDQFRILRLGRLKLNQDIVSSPFTVSMVPKTASGFQIRQIIIAKPRSPKPPK